MPCGSSELLREVDREYKKHCADALGMQNDERYEIGRVLHLGVGSAYPKQYISYEGGNWDPLGNGNENYILVPWNGRNENQHGFHSGQDLKQDGRGGSARRMRT